MAMQVQASTAAAPVVPAIPTTTAVASNAPAAGQYPMSSLYVGDLGPDVTESMLYNKFATAGPVLSIRVCRDAITRRSLGYAYVNFQQPADAERALDTMNFDLLQSKPIRIMWSQRDPTVRRSGSGNIFIKNLDPNIDTKSIYDTFSMFGRILSCKVACDGEGKSKGYGFIHFETDESAQKAIDKVNGMLLDNKVVFVGKFLPRSARFHESGGPNRFTNVYVKNFADKLDDVKLKEMFEKYGKITSCIVMKDGEEKSRGFGFVSFENHEDAERAVKELNGIDIPDSEAKLFACRAQKKSERQAELASVYEEYKAERLQRYQGMNLYVKNLDDSINSDELRRNFEQYGTIASAKVMCDENQRSRGFGFVCFETPDDAAKAVLEMNNRMINGKPLYVALFQRKEDRRAQLAAQYMAKISSSRLANSQSMQVYAQPSQMMPMMQPGMPIMQPMMQSGMGMPMVQQGMQQRWNGNTGYGYMVQPTQQRQQFGGMVPRQQYGGAPRQQQQGRPQNRYPPQQSQGQGRPMVPQAGLESKLAGVDTMEQKQQLGELLYPIVGSLCKEKPLVGKITGMMLEMPIDDIRSLLERPDAIKGKVAEAIVALSEQPAKP